MDDTTLPYFFPETLQPVTRKQPSERERARHFTIKDLEWLKTLLLASHAERSTQADPMEVSRILLNTPGNSAPLILAGTFMMGLTPDEKKVLLYTPYGGLEKFDDADTLMAELTERLDIPAKRIELLRFQAIAQRTTLKPEDKFTLDTSLIEGEVYEDQAATIKLYQSQNVQAMLTELLKLPTLTSILNATLNSALQKHFPGLDQSQTRMNSFIEGPSQADNATERLWVDSVPLSEALLSFYQKQAWPLGRVREFVNPKRPNAAEHAAIDKQLWEQAVKDIAGSLTVLLNNHLESFWNTDISPGQSRLAFFAEAMSDKSRMDLLFKRQEKIITAQQSQQLASLFLQDGTLQQNHQAPLHIEKVRIWEHYPRYVEPASTLMISNSDTYLYTQAEGWQLFASQTDLLNAVQAMTSAAGHEDQLYASLALQERQQFTGFDHPHISAGPVPEAVFPDMIQGIVDKQRQNLEYVLGIYRRSEGILDIGALLDHALDIRAMLDNRLLTLDVRDRWSTRPVASHKQYPSTVQMEKAKRWEQTLNSIADSLDKEIEGNPDYQSMATTEEMKSKLAQAMSVGIRAEAELRVLNKTLTPQDQAIINTGLNPDFPDRQTRQGLNGFRPDAYSLTLERTGQQTLLPLAHCLLLSERGGIDRQHSGRVILWTPALGLEVFSTVSSVRTELARRLASSQERLTLLENLKAKDRSFHQRYSLGPFRLIERNVAQDRQQSYIEHYLAERARTLALDLPANQLLSLLDALKKKPAPLNLQRARQVAQAITHQQSLPVWLGMASAQEQQLHAEILEQYRNNVEADLDYLHGIQSIRDYAQQELTELLKRRYPQHSLDPSQVSITPRLAIAASKQTLTDFALNHFDGLDDSHFTVASETTQVLPEQLNPVSVRQLVRQLDIKTHYQTLVETHLTLGNPGAADRQQRFIKQLPWQVLQHAHGLKLQERLCDRAYSLIQQVMDMPDATARSIVSGATALVRPLELIATEGAAAVKALGLYLIGPEPGNNGPQILYSPYFQNHVLKEYEDERSLLNELRTAGALQNWLLNMLPETYQATYRNLLAATNNQSADIRLASNPINGNLLKQLFNDNTALLLKLLGSQSPANHQAEWETVKNLFSNGVPQAFQFLAGKLAYPLVVWQSFKSFLQSAEDLQEHKWGPALKTFIDGLAQLATIRNAMEALPSTPASSVTKEAVVPAPRPEPSDGVTTWSDMDLTAPQRTRLQPYEVMDVALSDLKKSQSHGVHMDPVTNRQYIPLAGKVYQVGRRGYYWQIINDHNNGPFVRKANAQRWVFDTRQHLPRFGGALTRLSNNYQIWSIVRSDMNIEATGMKDIRRLYPEKAQMIGEALELALVYTNNCKHNLRLLAPSVAPVTRIHRYLKTFFNVQTIDSSLEQKLTSIVDKLLLALVDPSLTSLDSTRFVTGAHRTDAGTHLAFTIPADTDRKLYLSDRFFNTGLHLYQPHLIVPFDIDTHARAATIIHELTHLECATEDIAYLESLRPFPDLLADTTGKNLKDALLHVQTTALSTLTPVAGLFQVLDKETDTWVNPGDTENTEHIEDHILNLTGGIDLAEARRIFYADPLKRIDTLLGNADSVTCLVTQLGRQLDAIPSSRAVSPIP